MRIHTGLGTALIATLLAVTPLSATAAPESQGPGADRRSARAEAALDKAQALFEARAGATSGDGRHARRTTVSPAAEHTTLVLRDLAVGLDDLAPADRKAARRILARPTDEAADPQGSGYDPGTPTESTCSDAAAICVHWVTDQASQDAPPKAEGDVPGVPPAWVTENQHVFEEVWQRIVGELGYRKPRPDDRATNHGPDDSTDIYLAELGQFGMYGYCTMDDIADRAAYCVVDNDFEGFPASPEKSLKVTAAHEFFHAVQFAYNPFADFWLMEGTAAWVEDEVYDSINDNLQYLSRSPLRRPGKPLDFIDLKDPNSAYGSWIWWRFLTEYLRVDGKASPLVVRQIWQHLALDGARQGSLAAQRAVLSKRGVAFRQAFADFGAVNRVAPRWYDEGRRYGRFVAPPAGRFVLTKDRPSTGWKATELDHLSTRHAVLRPAEALVGPWRVRVELDLPPRARGSMASMMVHRRGGGVTWRSVRLDRNGDGRFAALFNHRKVSHVALSLTNASTRMRECGRHQKLLWSCLGEPVDENLLFAFRARAVR